MNRRDFFRKATVGGLVIAGAVQEWPFRVFSFPTEIKIVSPQDAEEILAKWSGDAFETTTTIRGIRKFYETPVGGRVFQPVFVGDTRLIGKLIVEN